MGPRKTGAAAPRQPVASARDDAGVPYALARERILAAIRAIPRGQVAAYGEVARRAGLPGRARLTARVLGDHDDPDLPWHRVLRADGRIAFPEGSKGWREQSARLRAEGVVVSEGRVKLQRAALPLDAELWRAPD